MWTKHQQQFSHSACSDQLLSWATEKIIPVKGKLETLVLVRGITVFTVRVEDVFIVGLLTRLAVLATLCKRQNKMNERMYYEQQKRNRKRDASLPRGY